MPRFGRRPRVKRMIGKGDVEGKVEGLREALRYHDRLVDKSGEVVDLAVPTRVKVVAALASLESEEAARGLAEATEDEARDVRMVAVVALGDRDEDLALDALAASAARLPDAEDREAAFELLAERDDPDASMRLATALALETARPLDSSDHEMVLRLRREDGQRRDRAVEALTDIMVTGESQAQNRAMQILVWHSADSIDPLLAVLAQTESDDLDTRRRTVMALGTIRDTRAVNELCHLLREDPHPGVRSLAAWALGQLGDPLGAETLIAATLDDDFEVRTHAARSLVVGTGGWLAKRLRGNGSRG